MHAGGPTVEVIDAASGEHPGGLVHVSCITVITLLVFIQPVVESVTFTRYAKEPATPVFGCVKVCPMVTNDGGTTGPPLHVQV